MAASAGPTFHGKLVWTWGLGGTLALVVTPLPRLAGHAADAFAHGLTPLQWGLTILWCLFMAYAEGYRGFHLRFSPRAVVRAEALARAPHGLPALLAPLTCMGLLHATRRRLIASWALILGIVLIVLVVRTFPPPWRGIVDFGVVLGLSIGAASIVWHAIRSLRGEDLAIDPDLPASSAVAHPPP